ncbi:MAG: hypothetical protein RL272_654 [Candidatus Parcubacteria bacterium]|jgi:competence protein ComEC
MTFDRRHRFLIIAVLGFAIGAKLVVADPRLTVTVFDVGQGDAILVQCGRRQLLIDGGPDASVLAGLGRSMPLFDRDIDAAVLTHPHADHFIGLVSVIGRYRVRRLFVSRMEGRAPEFGAFADAVSRAGLDPVRVRTGDSIAIGGCGTAEVLWPADDAAAAAKDPNAASVVLRLRSSASSGKGDAVMLMGDATADVEDMILSRGADVRADVLKAGHHGSRFSTTAEWIEAVRPKEAAISVGKNSYGHPAWSTLRRLEVAGVRVSRTDLDGDIRFAFTPAGVMRE